MCLLFTAAIVHQGFATVAPPTAAPTTTAAPHKDPSNPEKGNYVVNGKNDTACLLAAIGVQLNVSFSSVSQNQVLSQTQVLQLNNKTRVFSWN